MYDTAVIVSPNHLKQPNSPNNLNNEQLNNELKQLKKVIAGLQT